MSAGVGIDGGNSMSSMRGWAYLSPNSVSIRRMVAPY